jgi:hypothetical protein
MPLQELLSCLLLKDIASLNTTLFGVVHITILHDVKRKSLAFLLQRGTAPTGKLIWNSLCNQQCSMLQPYPVILQYSGSIHFHFSQSLKDVLHKNKPLCKFQSLIAKEFHQDFIKYF